MLQVLDHDDRSHELLAVTAVDFCYSVIDSYTLLEPHLYLYGLRAPRHLDVSCDLAEEAAPAMVIEIAG